MLFVDPRAGSGELLPILRNRFRLPAHHQNLEFADIAFAGHGPKGWCDVGIEVKKLPDLLSSKEDGRFIGHQLRGLYQDYDYVSLLVIGEWCADREGFISTPRRNRGKVSWWRDPHNCLWRDLESWLMTLKVKGGVRVERFDNPYYACRWIEAQYRWWQKRWDKHHSLDQFYTPPPDDRRLLLGKHSLTRLWAKELPGIEWTLSQRVEERFPSALDLAQAAVSDLVQIPGIGKAKAKAAFDAIRARRKTMKKEGKPRARRRSK